MAQLAIAAVGALAGGSILGTGVVALGLTGPAIGWAVGSMIGSTFGSKQKSQGPRLNDLAVNGTEYGQAIPWVAGSPRISGQIIWASNKRETAKTEEVGKGGGGSFTSYSYDVDLLILLSDNEITGFSRIWLNNELITDGGFIKPGTLSRITVYTGAPDQLPDPTYEAAVGSANAVAYRGRGCVFIEGLQLGSGGRIPNLSFEVGSFTQGQYATNSSLLLSAFVTRRDTNPGPFDAFDISYTSLPTWESYFAEFGSSAILSANYYTNDSPVLIYTVPGKTLPIDITHNYNFRTVNGFWSGDISDCFVEFLNGAGQVVAAVKTVDENASEFTSRFFYGTSLTNMTYLAENIVTDGIFSFQDNLLVYTNQNGYGFNGSGGRSFTLACNALSIRSARFSGIRLRSTYKGGVQNPNNQVIFQKLGKPGSEGGSSSTYTNLGLVTDKLMTRSEYPEDSLEISSDFSNKLVRGLTISQVSPTRNTMEMLQQSYFFDVVASDKIYFRPRSTTPVVTIPYSDLALTESTYSGQEPLSLQLLNELELPSQIAVQYYNTLADYQVGTEYSDRLVSSQQSVSNIQFPLGLEPSEAKKIAEVMLQESMAAQVKTKLVLPLKYSYLEPTDVILVQNENNTKQYRFRITSKTDSGYSIELDCVTDDANSTLSAGTTSVDYVSQTSVIDISDSLWYTLDIPILREADSSPGHYIAAKKSSTDAEDIWPGANVLRAWDGTNFSKVNEFLTQCIMGSTTSTLGNFTYGNIVDEINTVDVNIVLQELSSSNRVDVLSNKSINAALIGNEIIQFINATLISTGVYRLSGLIRGCKGTEQYINSHQSGERFVLLDSNIRRVNTTAAQIGTVRDIKVVTYNMSSSTITPESFTDSGVALKPLNPVNLRADYSASGINLTWIRRTRYGYRYVGTLGVSVPLGEDLELYRLRFYDGANLVRTELTSTPDFMYTTAMQTEDGFTSLDSVIIKIAQVSSIIGDGFDSSITLITNN